MQNPLNSGIGNTLLITLLFSILCYGCSKSSANSTDYIYKTNSTNYPSNLVDSLRKLDSLKLLDSVNKAAIKFKLDSLNKLDSLFRVDSLQKADSLKRLDSINKADLLAKAEAERKLDSINKAAAQRKADSIAAIELQRKQDSINRAALLRKLDSIAKVTEQLRADSLAKIEQQRKLDSIEQASKPPVVVQPPVTAPPPIIPPPANTNQRIINVGYGFGDLVIDGNNLIINNAKTSFQNNDLVLIKGGSYNSITIKNISVPDGKRVLIVNDGLITLNGDFKAMYLSELNNVTISGNGTTGNDRGFAFLNNKFRAVIMEGQINNFTLQNMLFKNISDYVIFYNGLDKKVYAGSSDSYVRNLAFLNLDGDNIGPLLQLSGEIETARFTGLIKGIEVAGVTCINSPDIGAAIFLGNCEDYNVHDNFMNNINAQNNNHNGIFMLRGNGKFYNNMVKNHQGNAIRAWIYSVDGTKTVEIFNNIVYNSRKYSAFELQVPPYIKASSLFKPANAKVYNNTVGKMNTEKSSFPGRVLDLYNTWGTLEIYNNLFFDMNDNILINDNSDTQVINNSNNVYENNFFDAVLDLTNFISKILGTGANKQ